MSLMKKAIGGSIHRIREFELEKVNLIDEFDILQIVGEGWFGKILLTEHRSTQTEMVLKALPKAYTGISDFFREFHYGLHLGAHKNIITTYDVCFETAGFYVFSQEYAPLGDLTSNVTETGLGELHAKRVARQLASAVQHIHSRELVHRDIKLDNILVFKSDFSRIKLCDFGETRRLNTVVRRHNEWLPYSPPEVLQIDTDETYKALTSHDVWQFGIVLFVCLTGCLPWQKAALDDPRYTRYQNWHNATLNIAKKPKLFQLISSRAQRLFKRLLDPKAEKRPVSVLEVNKYLEDRWLAKLGAEKAMNGGADERDELCPSMYSFHSSLEEKNQLLHTLTTYGIETTVDRAKKKDRIREWIQASAIVEEYEEDESDLNEDIRIYEDEDKEPSSMKGRHFPETRPVVKNEPRKHRNRAPSSAARKRQIIKPTERKIPFAPQVAEEREAIARFASFPNGDPNLAILKNGTNGNSIPPLVLPLKTESTVEDTRSLSNGQVLNNSPASSLNTSQDDFVPTNNASGYNKSNLQQGTTSEHANFPDFQEHPTIARGDAIGDRSLPRSPQIPNRRHRSQTAPFPGSATSPLLNGNRADSTKRSQSATVLASASQPDMSNLVISRSAERSVVDSQSTVSAIPRGENSTPRAEHRSAAQSMSRVENQSVVMLPAAARVENQLSNALPVARNEKSVAGPVATTNPLTMSVASHLVMQSFNALQGINTVSDVVNNHPTVNLPTTPKNSPSSTPSNILTPKNSPTTTPVRTSTPPKHKNHKIEEPMYYGKDPFEQYGIAQGVILRAENARRGSLESGNRSASN
ncbi:Serine/threonine-protein kinase meng-po [Anthophora retusa]